jgi:carbohydrate-selective porin OprB
VNDANGGSYLGFNGGTGVELPLEVGLTLKDRDGNLRGNVRIGGYYDTSQVWDYATRAIANITLAPLETNAVGLANNAAAIASIQPNYVRGRSGAYVQMDHTIGSGSGAGQAGTAIFAAFEYSDPQTSLVTRCSISASCVTGRSANETPTRSQPASRPTTTMSVCNASKRRSKPKDMPYRAPSRIRPSN